MRLRHIYALLIAMVLSAPIEAQVYLDSAEVARVLSGKDSVLLSGDDEATIEDDNGDDEGYNSYFQNDSCLTWQQNIKARLDGILQGNLMETTQVGVMVWDLTDDKRLYSYRERVQMRPASTMKCVTAIAALDRLGSDYSFQTRIYYTGSVDDSTQVLNGDIYCVGGMDPLIGGTDITAIAESIRQLNIRTINGNFYADRSFKDKDELGWGWCWDDKNPSLNPLLVNKRDNFISLLRERLHNMGVTHYGIVGERTVPNNARLITTRLHSIEEVMRPMMKKSDNLFAESMFYQIAAAGGGKWSTAKQAASYIKGLIRKVGLTPSNYNIADGSGLSLYNYVSPELEVQLLRYAFQNRNIYDILLKTLPIAGIDGTLRRRMRGTPAAGNVRAKTGTVMGVSSLAGYLTASNQHRLCFSIIVNGGMSNGPMRRLQNSICVALSK